MLVSLNHRFFVPQSKRRNFFYIWLDLDEAVGEAPLQDGDVLHSVVAWFFFWGDMYCLASPKVDSWLGPFWVWFCHCARPSAVSHGQRSRRTGAAELMVRTAIGEDVDLHLKNGCFGVEHSHV